MKGEIIRCSRKATAVISIDKALLKFKEQWLKDISGIGNANKIPVLDCSKVVYMGDNVDRGYFNGTGFDTIDTIHPSPKAFSEMLKMQEDYELRQKEKQELSHLIRNHPYESGLGLWKISH